MARSVLQDGFLFSPAAAICRRYATKLHSVTFCFSLIKLTNKSIKFCKTFIQTHANIIRNLDS